MSTLKNDHAHKMTRMQQKKHDRQQQIARIAWQMFTEHGYEKVTTRQVSEAADIATGTLFLYAENKGALLVLAFEDALRTASTPHASLPEHPLEALLVLFGGPLHLYAKHRTLARHFLVEVLRNPASDVTTSNLTGFLERIEGVLALAQQQEQLDPQANVRQAAQNLFGIYLMVIMQWLPTDQDLAKVQHTLRQAFELQWKGLQPCES